MDSNRKWLEEKVTHLGEQLGQSISSSLPSNLSVSPPPPVRAHPLPPIRAGTSLHGAHSAVNPWKITDPAIKQLNVSRLNKAIGYLCIINTLRGEEI